MKLSYALSLIIAVSLILSCEKPEPESPAPASLPEHCSNGLMDNGELDTDCGGECNPCGTIAPPCQMTENTLYLLEEEVLSCVPVDTVTVSFRDTMT